MGAKTICERDGRIPLLGWELRLVLMLMRVLHRRRRACCDDRSGGVFKEDWRGLPGVQKR